MYPSILENLISSFKKLPGVGERSAERFALAAIEFSDEEIENYKIEFNAKDTKSLKLNIYEYNL